MRERITESGGRTIEADQHVNQNMLIVSRLKYGIEAAGEFGRQYSKRFALAVAPLFLIISAACSGAGVSEEQPTADVELVPQACVALLETQGIEDNSLLKRLETSDDPLAKYLRGVNIFYTGFQTGGFDRALADPELPDRERLIAVSVITQTQPFLNTEGNLELASEQESNDYQAVFTNLSNNINESLQDMCPLEVSQD